jgi:hypothetical protein
MPTQIAELRPLLIEIREREAVKQKLDLEQNLNNARLGELYERLIWLRQDLWRQSVDDILGGDIPPNVIV